MKLTKTVVDGLAPREAKYVVACSATRGLSLRVEPSGVKVYLFRYRTAEGKQKNLTLGRHGEISTEQARKLAEAARGEVVKGEDPHGRKVEVRTEAKKEADAKGLTVEKLAERYIENAKLKPRTKTGYEVLLRRHILPAIGGKPAGEVRRADVMAMHESITAKGLNTQANRAVAVAGSLFTYAIAAVPELAEMTNPARGLRGVKHREVQKERFLTKEELQHLLDVLATGETDGLPWTSERKTGRGRLAWAPERRRYVVPANVASVIRLLIFTGARLREILELRWSEINFAAARIDLSDARSKAGARSIMLPAKAVAELQAVRKRSGKSAFVFPVADGSRPLPDINRAWFLLRVAAGFPDLRLHDLRHSFVSLMIAAGVPLDRAGPLVGHRSAATTKRYSHLSAAQMAEDARRVDDILG